MDENNTYLSDTDIKEETSFKNKIKNYFNLYKLDTKGIATNGIIAALYTVLTYAFFFISYGPIQFRISEFLVLIVFFNPNYICGLTLGCLLSNIYAPAASSFCSPLDLAFGVSATLLACLIIPLCRHLAIASILPAVFNGFLLAIEFSFVASDFSIVFFFTNVGTVALGEIVCVTVLGLIVFYRFSKTQKQVFHKVTNAKIHLDYKW